MDKSIIVYDGNCGFCNKIIFYIAKKDSENNFIFISNLSKKGNQLLKSGNYLEISKYSIIVIHKSQIYTFGEALQIIFSNININRIFQKIILITNLKILNFIYQIIARNRLFLFNKTCKLPPKEVLIKFITV